MIIIIKERKRGRTINPDGIIIIVAIISGYCSIINNNKRSNLFIAY